MRTILVVENEVPIAQLLIDLLSEAGHRVVIALNGVEALMHLQAVRPDLIISNVSLPLIDGVELCQKLQTKPELSAIPVVFISAAQTKLDLEVCKYAALIKKPFGRDELLGTVNQTLGGRHD